MIIPDVNLLLYAVITGFPQHDRARTWWEEVVGSSAQIGLTAPAVFGFVRLATSRRLLEQPLTVDAAVSYVREWTARPNVQVVSSGERHLDIALDLLGEVGTAGNLTTDVQLAAHAIEHRAELHSNDSDFAKFTSVSWVNPLT